MDGMDGMDGMDTSAHGAMSSMTVVFQTNRATPLYANSWTPQSAAAYAGTCIFLVVLAVAARLLLAARSLQEARWLDKDLHRRYVAAHGKVPLSEEISNDARAAKMTLSANGVEETVFVVARHGCEVRPWRFSVDPLRAVMDTVIVGVGYLLYAALYAFLPQESLMTRSMLAVMTMNVGYFFSILAGVFVGSLAVGRYSSVGEH
ncbi:hypothetical protein E4U53_000828 [Claviceps sorghi]|nr:hypothetical protein E4U53_000828 [Claviceps sorghi]